ncbi:GNAT family N-acetyltransferase [Lactobacillus sp. 3B(2020)]|uniref:GNAT family N-acetyltransferase n=1 Tax=Lactobacillus sp. 3B(2020) TaxID=2695882 RepID=UPI0015E01FCB|nr:GNAT family N-acetyltransferase [Lactobacillus sp. 3B(2020)]QLL69164.1 NADPH-dependent FMN reductase [Lactobacillus sp. 3B(2020)]
MVKIGVLVGSLSKRAFSLKLAQYITYKEKNLEMLQLDYSSLPLYDPDIDLTNAPVEWVAFRRAVSKVSGLLIVMPEYNLSIPGGLKNALDVISVPKPDLPAQGKPVLVITDSSGSRGGMLANAHLHQVLQNLGAKVLPSYVTVGNVNSILKENRITDDFVDQAIEDQFNQFKSVIFKNIRDQNSKILVTENYLYAKTHLGLLENNKEVGWADLTLLENGSFQIDHVVVKPEDRGKGVAQRVMLLLLSIMESSGLKVVPKCPFARDFIKQHFEYEELAIR